MFVVFFEGVYLKTFYSVYHVIHLQIPEEHEYFTIRLENATDEASLGTPDTAQILILENDYAIHFKGE